jgi:hypothetical protein
LRCLNETGSILRRTPRIATIAMLDRRKGQCLATLARLPFRGSHSSFLLKFGLLQGCSMNELLTNEPSNWAQRSVSTPLSGLVDLCVVHKNRHLPRPALGPRLGPPFHLACPAVCWSRCAPRFILFPWVPCACNRRTSNAEHLSRSNIWV